MRNLHPALGRVNDENFRTLKREVAPWPDALRFDVFNHMPRTIGNDFDHPSNFEIRLAHNQLARVRNAFGKALLADLLLWEPETVRKLYYVALANHALWTTVVALNIYESRHNRLPENLKALVDEKIIETIPFKFKKESLTVTISIGFTKYAVTDEADEAFNRADKALYHAKSNGKNQVSFIDIVAK